MLTINVKNVEFQRNIDCISILIDMTLNKGSKPVLNGLQIGLNQSCRTIHRQTEKL